MNKKAHRVKDLAAILDMGESTIWTKIVIFLDLSKLLQDLQSGKKKISKHG
jgi:hypothetical protein